MADDPLGFLNEPDAYRAPRPQPPPLPSQFPPPVPTYYQQTAQPPPRHGDRFKIAFLVLAAVITTCAFVGLFVYLYDRSEAEADRQRKLDSVRATRDYLDYAEKEEAGAFLAYDRVSTDRLKRLKPGDKDLPPATEQEKRIIEDYRNAKETAERVRESYNKACRIAGVEP
jgi:hypothetical protein